MLYCLCMWFTEVLLFLPFGVMIGRRPVDLPVSFSAYGSNTAGVLRCDFPAGLG